MLEEVGFQITSTMSEGIIKIILCGHHSPFILSVLGDELSSIAFARGSWLLAHSCACPLTAFFLQSV